MRQMNFRFSAIGIALMAFGGLGPVSPSLAQSESGDFDFESLFAESGDNAADRNTGEAATSDSTPAQTTDSVAAASDEPAATDTETLDTIPVDALSPQEPQPTTPKPSSRRLEEIVVVAQKKAELIQDVPISISVIDEKFINDWSITDLNTAALYTPNVKVADAGYFILPRIRGFGTDQNNKAFEPPAGVALDGVPYTRLEYFTAATFDLARMEVYRGPQGTAFGKNTTAGLIHLITNSPSEETEGFFDVQYGNYDRHRIEAAVGGPMVEGFLNFRIAGLSDDRTGFIRNSATDQSLHGADPYGRGTNRKGLRLKLDFVDLAGSRLKLSAETVKVELSGAGLEMYNPTDTLAAAIRRYEPNTDFIRGNNVNTIDDKDFRNVAIDTYNAEWQYEIGEWSLTALGGYSVLRDDAALDTDATPAPAIFAADKDTSPTVTGELRLQSPQLDGLLGLNNVFGLDLGTSEVLGGLYYQGRDIKGDGIVFRFGLSYLDLLIASQASQNGSPVPSPAQTLLSLIYPLIPAIFQNTNSDYTEEVTQDFDQQAEASAAFSQFKWQLNPVWGVEYGIRFNHETKKAQLNQYYSSSPSILLPLLGVTEYQHDLSRSEDNVAHRVSLNFEPGEDFGIFLHWAKGFRGGGFNAFSFDGSPGTLDFEPETAIDWGLDFKSTLLDGSMRFNVSLFRLDVNDFQVLVSESTSTGIGLGTTMVQNAAKARSQGIEADMTWLPTEWFTLFSTFGLNDTEYLDFTNNACAPDNKNTDGDADPLCDVTGKPFPLTPKYTATMLGMVTLPLSSSGLGIQIGGGFDYQSQQFTDTSLDDRFVQGNVLRWRATIGFGNVFQGWAFRLQGENLTDERITIRHGQLIPGIDAEGVDAPRMIYGSFRYTFGS